MSQQITGVRLAEPNGTITHFQLNNTKRLLTKADVIELIESGEMLYVIGADRSTSLVEAVTHSSGHKYLKTDSDKLSTNNLLDLPKV